MSADAYRKKPVVIEARQLEAKAADPVWPASPGEGGNER